MVTIADSERSIANGHWFFSRRHVIRLKPRHYADFISGKKFVQDY